MTADGGWAPVGPEREGDLDALVGRTEGVQPTRRLFHAVSGLAIAALVDAAPLSTAGLLAVLGAGLLVALAIDWVRLRRPTANVWFYRLLRPLASPRERDRLASSTWYLIGVIAALLIAPRPLAVSAILVLALADPTASVVGRIWGRRRIGSGTVLGTAAFVAVATLVLLGRHPPAVALSTAVIVAAAEVAKIPLDDNLVVPVTGALALRLLGLF